MSEDGTPCSPSTGGHLRSGLRSLMAITTMWFQECAMDQSYDRLWVAAARADFLDSPREYVSGVPDLVAASWRRSHSAGVDSERYAVPFHDDLDLDTRLARCARPVLERLTLDMSDVPVSIALADAKASIIDRRDCSRGVGRVLDRVDFNPGFNFDEVGVGTNGIGTVFEAGVPISVVGSAHFNEALTPFACTGAPVIDPITRRIEGVLDVSLLAESWNPLVHAIVKTAADDIGRNLMLDRSRAEQALFEAYVKADARTRHGVVAVGDTIILNHRAQGFLSAGEQLAVVQHARFLTARRTVRSDVLTLHDGRSLRVRIARVEADGDTTGVILIVSDASEAVPDARGGEAWSGQAGRAPIDELPQHHATAFEEPWLATSTCAAWHRASSEVWESVRAAEPFLLIGERGSGRGRLLADAYARACPDGHVVVVDDVADLDNMRPGPAMVLLRNLDVLTARQIGTVAARVAGLPESVQLAATATASVETSHPASGLMHIFRGSAEVPGLRHRAGDIPHLAGDLLAELAPAHRVRLSPRALRALAAYSWPGNIPQLQSALTEALARRPAGEIQVEDLPGWCRSTSARQLSALEAVERDAILSALTTHAGNRVHAASSLGMARSTLYRKLKYYAITET